MELKREYDVVVAGGGTAGISAALAAARNGAKVLLVEKESLLGGLATLGLVTIFLPLCDGCGNQVVHGIGEELLHMSIRHGAESELPKAWLEGGTPAEKKEKRFEVQYNPNLFALEAERKLLEENVEILYDTRIVNVQRSEDGRTLEQIIVSNKSGLTALAAKVFIDCTGDADLFFLAGADTDIFEGNNCAAWYYRLEEGKLLLTMLGLVESGDNDTSVEVISDKLFSGVDGFENSQVLVKSHQALLEDFLKRREKKKDMVPVNVASILQVRKSRKIKGADALTPEDLGKQKQDSVGMIGDWRWPNRVFAIPYGTLYSPQLSNVLTAGRSISVEDDAWEVTRVIPACCVTGQAAGTAAAMAAKAGIAVEDVDVRLLQEKLQEAGAKIQ